MAQPRTGSDGIGRRRDRTQNPSALSNAGLWCVGRLQTDADRARVVEGMKLAQGDEDEEYDAMLRHLKPRWFVMRNTRVKGKPKCVQPRWAISVLRGPMTRQEIRAARETFVLVRKAE